MSDQISVVQCPWPGPQPYKEEDATRFFGRKYEIQEFISKNVNRHRLNIIVSGSGTGKTSFIQAGLIPALRRMRESEGQNTAMGVTLLLREWGELAGLRLKPRDMILRAIKDEIDRLSDPSIKIPLGSERLRQDIEFIKDIQMKIDSTSSSDLLTYLSLLCDCPSIGSLMIIFDQAEELLGSGARRPSADTEHEVLDVIEKIHEREHRIQLIISLREEYESRLRKLHVPDLAVRRYYLDPMQHDMLKNVISESSKHSTYMQEIDASTIDRVLLYSAGDEDNNSKDLSNLPDPELLKVQALLWELFRYAKPNKQTRKLMIGHNEFDEFSRSLGSPPGKELLDKALERYISRIFSDSSEREVETDSNNEMMIPMSLVRHTAARFVPSLSSPSGFKRHIESSELLSDAIGDELRTITTNVKSQGEFDKQIGKYLSDFLDNKEQSLERLLLFLFGSGNELCSGRDLRSGKAREYNWDLRRTATNICLALFKSIAVLEKNNILKTGLRSDSEGRIFELVHDLFGPALRSWGDMVRSSPADSVSSVVARLGESFSWQGLTFIDKSKDSNSQYRLNGLCWLGCSLAENTVISNILFSDCDLSGAIFPRCIIRNCSFQNCNLNGAVFAGGAWENVSMDSCKAPSILLTGGLSWEKVNIESSVFDQLTVESMILKGKVNFDDCSMRLSIINEIIKEDGRIYARDCDFYNTIFKFWDENTWRLDDLWRDEIKRKSIPESLRPQKGPIGCRT